MKSARVQTTSVERLRARRMARAPGNDGNSKWFRPVGVIHWEPSMTDETEIGWHKEQIAKNRTVLEELEAGNTSGGDVFPETRSEMDHLKAQIAQSELIVAAYEKRHPQTP
jgi:hypothetical protein